MWSVNCLLGNKADPGIADYCPSSSVVQCSPLTFYGHWTDSCLWVYFQLSFFTSSPPCTHNCVHAAMHAKVWEMVTTSLRGRSGIGSEREDISVLLLSWVSVTENRIESCPHITLTAAPHGQLHFDTLFLVARKWQQYLKKGLKLGTWKNECQFIVSAKTWYSVRSCWFSNPHQQPTTFPLPITYFFQFSTVLDLMFLCIAVACINKYPSSSSTELSM